MQPYRQLRPHDPATCQRCVPSGIGHQGCQQDRCDEIAETQHQRHATDAEYAALPESFVPADGICLAAVFMCGDHELDPFCGPEDHRLPQPEQPDPLTIECPKCSAAPGAECVKPDGSARRSPHDARGPQAQPAAFSQCNHAHRADCEGYGACQCSPDDPAPTRPEAANRRELEPADFLRAFPPASP